MRLTIAIAAALIALCAGAPAVAACPGPEDGTGTARALDPGTRSDVDLIISMSMMPKLMHVDYAKATSQKLPCTIASFPANGVTYRLRASDANAGTGRVAQAEHKGAILAMLLPVTDIMAAIEAAKQHKATAVSGYLLATVSQGDLTGWRFYTGIPNRATLVADMAAALGGTGKPIFRNDAKTNKTSLFMPG